MSSPSAIKRKPVPAATSSSTSTSTMPKQTTHLCPTTVPPKTQYLVLYNLLSAILWYAVGLRFLLVGLFTGEHALLGGTKGTAELPHLRLNAPARPALLETVYSATMHTLLWTQTLAIAEVVHAAVGLVRAGVLTTAMQVASRLLLVWGVLVPFGERLLDGSSYSDLLKVDGWNTYAYAGMLFAWVASEGIRYLFFIFFLGGQSRMEKVPKGLRWLRYNSFFVLYPLGISCECWLIYHSIPFAREVDERLGMAFYAILAIYVPGSYILYTHMIKQRSRVLKGKPAPKARTE